MKRGWVVTRDQGEEFGEASEAAQRKALILAEYCDAEFIDSLIRAKCALDAFGGKLFIAAQRRKIDNEGKVADHNADGQYETLAYVVHYDHENVRSVTGEPAEPDLMFKDVERLFKVLMGEAGSSPNGEPDHAPDPAEVEG